MLGEEAKVLLGFLPDSTPSSSQVKEAYKKKALETHPDRFPLSQRSLAESNFKLISEAYTCLQSGKYSTNGTYSRVVRYGNPRSNGGSKNHALIRIPFLFIVLGTVALGGSSATRAYRRQKEAYPSHNPFLP
ncbi:chaperone DnaJ-domain superfamily protein [Artemisia annua]|uniref:Chaperone DnaJ-domain superfamily protein n=1 Tax=Artemisia annua TaxID=35608 RepID=A0A2U1QET4_ARTAN|nr:chaperone DnaJ-domain superfamily protein [Artemisia annua]